MEDGVNFRSRWQLEAICHRPNFLRDPKRPIKAFSKLGIMGSNGKLSVWPEADID